MENKFRWIQRRFNGCYKTPNSQPKIPILMYVLITVLKSVIFGYCIFVLVNQVTIQCNT